MGHHSREQGGLPISLKTSSQIRRRTSGGRSSSVNGFLTLSLAHFLTLSLAHFLSLSLVHFLSLSLAQFVSLVVKDRSLRGSVSSNISSWSRDDAVAMADRGTEERLLSVEPVQVPLRQLQRVSPKLTEFCQRVLVVADVARGRMRRSRRLNLVAVCSGR